MRPSSRSFSSFSARFFPVGFRFVLALVDDLLNFFFFLGGILGVECLIVFLNQSLHLLAVELHHFVGLHLSGLYLTFAIELVLLIAFNVGVVAKALIVFNVLVGDHAKQLLHLFLRELTVGIGFQVGQGSGMRRLFDGVLRLSRHEWRLILLSARQPGSKKQEDKKDAMTHAHILS